MSFFVDTKIDIDTFLRMQTVSKRFHELAKSHVRTVINSPFRRIIYMLVIYIYPRLFGIDQRMS